MANSINGHCLPTEDCSGLSDDFYNFAFKVMLVGDSAVGKTCLMIRFKDNTFLHNNFIATVGIDFRNKIIDLDGVKIKLQIWDTAGQERFRSLTHAYYRDANAVVLVFDLSARTTFEHCRSWMDDIFKYAQNDVIVFLVGNKSDLVSSRQIKQEEGLKLAEEYGITYAETSGKTGENVDVIFSSVAEDLVKRRTGKLTAQRPSIDLHSSRSLTQSWCCYR